MTEVSYLKLKLCRWLRSDCNRPTRSILAFRIICMVYNKIIRVSRRHSEIEDAWLKS